MQPHLPHTSPILNGEEAQAKRRQTRPVTAQLLDELSRVLSQEGEGGQMFPTRQSNQTQPMMDFALRVLQIPMSELTAASDMPCDKATIRVAIAVSGALANIKPGFSLVKQRFEAYENTTGRAQAEMAYTLFRCGLGTPSFWSSIRPTTILNAFNASKILSEVTSSENQDQPSGEASQAIRVMNDMVDRFGKIEDVQAWKMILRQELRTAADLLDTGKRALEDAQTRLERYDQSSTHVNNGVQQMHEGYELLDSLEGKIESTLDGL
ncbi:hypothetical protein BGZ61DRAFT_453118 [Ilyonectria robusta]|uniref:uncharacterized protein n=1 Tax=Ilyonectria robusta TaxID=1079257 RepID=UPI001E8EBBBB|nr:uncharacterized protein BGZ61DRAFT_453118 [Ilyonectria robusta]KAH8688360.1 hypothetical protein BGZ61DRAFT_453118 [Ilyonectria robusta]